MDVAKLFDKLELSHHVEVMVAALPELKTFALETF